MPQCGLSTCDDDTEELQQHNGHRALTGGPSISPAIRKDKFKSLNVMSQVLKMSLLNIRLNKIYDNRTAQQFFKFEMEN
jgi:hypothetical protein